MQNMVRNGSAARLIILRTWSGVKNRASSFTPSSGNARSFSFIDEVKYPCFCARFSSDESVPITLVTVLRETACESWVTNTCCRSSDTSSSFSFPSRGTMWHRRCAFAARTLEGFCWMSTCCCHHSENSATVATRPGLYSGELTRSRNRSSRRSAIFSVERSSPFKPSTIEHRFRCTVPSAATMSSRHLPIHFFFFLPRKNTEPCWYRRRAMHSPRPSNCCTWGARVFASCSASKSICGALAIRFLISRPLALPQFTVCPQASGSGRPNSVSFFPRAISALQPAFPAPLWATHPPRFTPARRARDRPRGYSRTNVASTPVSTNTKRTDSGATFEPRSACMQLIQSCFPFRPSPNSLSGSYGWCQVVVTIGASRTEMKWHQSGTTRARKRVCVG